MYKIFIIHFSVDKHLGCFQFWLPWREQQWMRKCNYFYKRMEIPLDKGALEVNGVLFCQGTLTLIFTVDLPLLVYSHQQWISVHSSPHPHQHVLSFVLLILAILTRIRQNLKVSLICQLWWHMPVGYAEETHELERFLYSYLCPKYICIHTCH